MRNIRVQFHRKWRTWRSLLGEIQLKFHFTVTWGSIPTYPWRPFFDQRVGWVGSVLKQKRNFWWMSLPLLNTWTCFNITSVLRWTGPNLSQQRLSTSGIVVEGPKNTQRGWGTPRPEHQHIKLFLEKKLFQIQLPAQILHNQSQLPDFQTFATSLVFTVQHHPRFHPVFVGSQKCLDWHSGAVLTKPPFKVWTLMTWGVNPKIGGFTPQNIGGVCCTLQMSSSREASRKLLPCQEWSTIWVFKKKKKGF